MTGLMDGWINKYRDRFIDIDTYRKIDRQTCI